MSYLKFTTWKFVKMKGKHPFLKMRGFFFYFLFTI